MAGPSSSHLSLASRVRARNRTRIWWIRAPLLLWFAHAFFGFLGDPAYRSLWSGINLAFHEIGRLLFSPFPAPLTALGGTLTGLALPIVVGVLLVRSRDDFGGALALFWLGTALAGAAAFGLLESDGLFFQILRTAGLGAMAVAIVAGGWVVTLMATDPDRPRATSRTRGGASDALAREDAAFRAWWAAREAEGEVPSVPEAPAGSESPPRSPPGSPKENEPGTNADASAGEGSAPDDAAAWLDRKEAHEGGLTPEEKRFREWLRDRE